MGRGGVSPIHFFYHMSMYEAASYLRGLERRSRDEWERTRRIVYTIAQVNSTKELSPENVLRLPWDNEEVTEEQMQQNEEELKKLRERAKTMTI